MMDQFYCPTCKGVKSVPADGICPKCGDNIRTEDNAVATEEDIAQLPIAPTFPEKRPPQIKVNGARHQPETFVHEDPPIGPIKKHIRPKKEDCEHPIILEKQIAFSQGERNAAVMRGMSLPNFASLDFCVNCWSVNPENFESEAHQLLAQLLSVHAKRNDGLVAPDPEKARAAWENAHNYMKRCNESFHARRENNEGMT